MKLRRYPGFWDARYRVGAWASLLHRISGIILSLYGVAIILAFSSAIKGADYFNQIMALLHSPLGRSFEMLALASLIYHCLNGFRIILFDLGIGIRSQKGIFWAFISLGVIFFLFTLYLLL